MIDIEQLLELGNRNFNEEKYKEAIDNFDVLIQNTSEAAINESKQLDNGIKSKTISLILSICQKAYYLRGLSYHKLKKYAQAILDYNETIKLNPKYVEAYYNRGLSYHKLKKHTEAMRDYNEAVRLESYGLNIQSY